MSFCYTIAPRCILIQMFFLDRRILAFCHSSKILFFIWKMKSLMILSVFPTQEGVECYMGFQLWLELSLASVVLIIHSYWCHCCVGVVASLSVRTFPQLQALRHTSFLLRIYSVLAHCYLQPRKAFTGKQSFDVTPLSGKVPLCITFILCFKLLVAGIVGNAEQLLQRGEGTAEGSKSRSTEHGKGSDSESLKDLLYEQVWHSKPAILINSWGAFGFHL